MRGLKKRGFTVGWAEIAWLIIAVVIIAVTAAFYFVANQKNMGIGEFLKNLLRFR